MMKSVMKSEMKSIRKDMIKETGLLILNTPKISQFFRIKKTKKGQFLLCISLNIFELLNKGLNIFQGIIINKYKNNQVKHTQVCGTKLGSIP